LADADGGVLERAAEPLLALPQRCFGPHSVGDVSGGADEANGFSVRVVREYMPVPSQQGTLRGESLLQNLEVAERSVIQRALANNEKSRAQVAHSLGISRVTLYKKMKKYDLMNASPKATHA
jgi:DNA-binding NtrC family response regulator